LIVFFILGVRLYEVSVFSVSIGRSPEYQLLGYRGYATSVYQQEAEVGAGHGFYLGLMQMGAFFVGKPSCFALNC
jgi:hypothetical protein